MSTLADRELRDLRSVGPATIADLALLNITSVAQLATCDPDQLYADLCRVTRQRHDPCVHDVFSAAVAQARDPALPLEQRNWWYWTKARKAKAWQHG